MEAQPLPPAEHFPVSASLPTPDALCATIAAAYPIAPPLQCQLWFAGTTDTYLVTTHHARYMLRLYQAGSRTDGEVRFELSVLHHLHRKGFAVAVPIRRRDGAWFGTLAAPEGPRQQVLFTYAPGREAYDEDGFAERFGRSIAALHTATDDFQSRHPRFQLDCTILLDRPLRWIQPLLAHRPTDWQNLCAIATRLRQRVEAHAI